MLSACIITKNEESNLQRCLESIKNHVSEIVINDTGSIDKTLQIAESYYCKILKNEWENDFAKARNQAIESASQPFILMIDADEVLQNGSELASILQSADSRTGGWLVTLNSKSGNKLHTSKLLRLFRNNGFFYKGSVHEQVVPSILSQEYKIENSNLKILHFGYDLPEKELQLKFIRNLKLLNLALEKEPDNTYYLYNKAKTELQLKNHDNALININLALKHEKSASMNAEFYKIKAKIYLLLKENSKALACIITALNHNPNDIESIFIRAELEIERGKVRESLEAYKKIVKNRVTNINLIAGSPVIPLSQLFYKIGKCYLLLKDYDSALGYFTKGIEADPEEQFSYAGASNAEFKLHNYDKALKYIEKAIALSPNDTKLHAIKKKILSSKPASSSDNKKKVSLSVSMIIKNEEKMLPGALDCIKEIADEIIITDTGSSDNSIEVAKTYNAKLNHFDWRNDFSAARNHSLSHCTSDWILYLDADERIEPESALLIKELISSADKNTGAFYCILESAHTTENGTKEIHRGGYPRLFRNIREPKIYFAGKIHEQISPSITKAGYKILRSKIKINHLGYEKDPQELENKAKRNYNLLMAQIKEDPENGYLWYQLGQTLGRLKLTGESERAIKFALECGVSDSIKASATAALSQYAGNIGKFDEALIWAEKSLEIVPKQVYGLNLKAHALLFSKQFEKAEEYFIKAIELSKNNDELPETGFDIDVPIEIMEKGLAKARNRNI